MTARERILLGIMRWAYAMARQCGENAEQASVESIEAAVFVKRVMS